MPRCPPQCGELDEYIIDSQRTVEVRGVEHPAIFSQQLLGRDVLEDDTVVMLADRF
jgi:hypothetical protein